MDKKDLAIKLRIIRSDLENMSLSFSYVRAWKRQENKDAKRDALRRLDEIIVDLETEVRS